MRLRIVTVVAWSSVIALLVLKERRGIVRLLKERRLPLTSSKKAFNLISNGLVSRGYAVRSGGWEAGSLGSVQEFEGHGRVLRLVWDGRDSEVFLDQGPRTPKLVSCSPRMPSLEPLVETILSTVDLL